MSLLLAILAVLQHSTCSRAACYVLLCCSLLPVLPLATCCCAACYFLFCRLLLAVVLLANCSTTVVLLSAFAASVDKVVIRV